MGSALRIIFILLFTFSINNGYAQHLAPDTFNAIHITEKIIFDGKLSDAV